MTSSTNLHEAAADNAKYRRLFQFLPDAASLTRAGDGTLLDANAAFELLTGYPREEIIGRRSAHLGCWLNPASWEEVYKALEATGEVRDFAARLKCKDGRLASILVTLRLLEMEGEPCYLAVARDITDRKHADGKGGEREDERAEAALKVLAAEKSMILDSTSDLVIYHDQDMRMLWMNREACDSVGMQPEELVGRHCWEIWHQRTEACNGCPVLAAFETREPQEAEIRSPDGRQWYIRGFPIRDHEGKVIGVTEFCLDITERKRMEEALGESEERYRTLFEGANDAILTIRGGIIVNCNNKALELFRTTREEFTGKSPAHFSPQLQPGGTCSVTKAREKLEQVAAGPPQVFQWRHRRGDGTLFDAEVSLNRLEYQGNLELLAILRDVTERREAEEQNRRFNEVLERRVAERTAELEEINRELESFCYTISHDLRAPLRAIDGFTHILAEDHETSFNEEGRQLCRRISGSAVRMGEMIDDLLNFSRIGRTALLADSIEMTELVRAVIDEIVPEEALRRIELRLAPLPAATGDPATLRQVWANLIDNAIKYSSNQPWPLIEVGGEQTGTETVFHVRDNGIGFDMAYGDKLFGVFERLHDAREFSGTGVGLAIVRRIVQRHGGRVWAEGSVGQGATLYFSLPVYSLGGDRNSDCLGLDES